MYAMSSDGYNIQFIRFARYFLVHGEHMPYMVSAPRNNGRRDPARVRVLLESSSTRRHLTLTLYAKYETTIIFTGFIALRM